MTARQFILPLAHELVVDLFAGGGGASTGIERRSIARDIPVAEHQAQRGEPPPDRQADKPDALAGQAGDPPRGTLIDPFMGSGSTLKAAELEQLGALGIELSAEYIDIASRRISADAPLLAEVAIT